MHPFAGAVATALQAHQVRVHLVRARGEELPFADGTFGLIVAISALEFVPDLPRACEEMRRILRPSGALVVVTPGTSSLVDLGFRLLTGVDPRQDFADRREKVPSCLLAHFAVERMLYFPPVLGKGLRLYSALRLRPLPTSCLPASGLRLPRASTHPATIA